MSQKIKYRIWVVEAKVKGIWEAQFDMDIHRTYAARLAEKFRKDNPHLNKRDVRIAAYARCDAIRELREK